MIFNMVSGGNGNSLIVFDENVNPGFIAYDSSTKYSISNGLLTFSNTANKKCALATSAEYNLTEYKTLNVVLNSGRCNIGIGNTRKASYDNKIAVLLIESTSLQVFSLDISSFSGNYYVGLYLYTQASNTAVISKIWLE